MTRHLRVDSLRVPRSPCPAVAMPSLHPTHARSTPSFIQHLVWKMPSTRNPNLAHRHSTSFDDLDQSCGCQRSLGLLAVAFVARSLTPFSDRHCGVESVSSLVRDLRREARVGLREINKSIRSTCTPSRPLSQERRDASRHDRARANAAQPNGYVAEYQL